MTLYDERSLRRILWKYRGRKLKLGRNSGIAILWESRCPGGFCKRWGWRRLMRIAEQDMQTGLVQETAKCGLESRRVQEDMPVGGRNLKRYVWADNVGKVGERALTLTEHLFCTKHFIFGISYISSNSRLTMFVTPLCGWRNRRWERLYLHWPTIWGQAYLITKTLVILLQDTASRWEAKKFKLDLEGTDGCQ